ncbi:hypothetical protein OF83DRAFT_1226993 [Amylostereum chailletii]|nr:hypothetical protein OF83DRAFT_1226993 [Amylostereum chailletii]
MLVGPKVYEFEEVFYSVPNQCLPTALLIVNVCYNVLTALHHCDLFKTSLLYCPKILISDAVVLWRAWILWSRNRYVQALSAHNARTICTTTVDAAPISEVLPSATVSDDPYGAAAFALSLCTNLWSTTLVAYKAWRHWRTVKAHLQRGNIRTRTEKVMSLLLESGTVYGLLWVCVGFSSTQCSLTIYKQIFVVGYTFDNVATVGFSAAGLRSAGDNFVKGALIQLVVRRIFRVCSLLQWSQSFIPTALRGSIRRS